MTVVGGELERPGRAGAVVEVRVPLVAQRAGRAASSVAPAACVAIGVLRQKRILPSAAGTLIALVAPALTMKIWPVSAFSGRPPSAGGLKRGSRHVPVQTPGSGSIFALAWVSL